jgi:beta-N-acetylhexosaminidase
VRRLVHVSLILFQILAPLSLLAAVPVSAPAAQAGVVAALLADMTPAEKVGQLFIVTFYGPTVEPGSEIERLITQSHVGGVLLLADHDNITDTTSAPQQVLNLTNRLQSLASAASDIPRETAPGQLGEAELPPYVPLFIATTHEGDNYPFTQIRSGLTELPSPLAVGATWDPEQAEAVGRITGRELAALGVNLLLGPPLDVLETPRPQGPWDMGASTFGGNGFWVGEMGQGYIRGVHLGSVGKMAVVAAHFPGRGNSDRDPDVEVPTVLRTLEQLRQGELVPFFAVTGNAPDANATADALLTAHIRFKGFQPATQQTASPVSLDPQALGQLLAQPELADWRARGGVTVSDSLGARAVKLYYESFNQGFNNRRIAREAFTAGNDLLVLSEFGLNPRLDQTGYITDTLKYFAEQYAADSAFRVRVDAAVIRILTLKLRLYGGRFDPALAARPESGLAELGKGDDAVRALAQSAASLINLTPQELAARAPTAPDANERMVFFTDTRQGRQCVACVAYPLLDKRALERAVVRLYGPTGSDQIREGNLQSFSFEDLAAYLTASAAPPPPTPEADETPTPEPSPVETALAQANWIVFAMLDVAPGTPASRVVSDFLAQRPDLARSKKIIVFGFGAPYYLDTTDLSKITVFYALYSKAPAFVEAAAQLLFRELAPAGASPVSVPSTDYMLPRIVAPDSAQTISIEADRTEGLKVGDTIRLRTGVILDRNGHAVPDGAPVRFSIFYQKEGLTDFIDTVAEAGVAETGLQLNRPDVYEITAASAPALNSRGLQIIVLDNTTVIVITVTPPPTPLPTHPGPTDTPAPPTPLAPTPETSPPTETGRVAGRDFILLCLSLGAVMVMGYRLGPEETPPSQRLRVALCGAIGALAGYNFYALGLPGANAGLAFGVLAATSFTALGAALGLSVGWYVFVRRAGAHAGR